MRTQTILGRRMRAAMVVLLTLVWVSLPSRGVQAQGRGPGLYRHTMVEELNSASFRSSLPGTYRLITIRGAAGEKVALDEMFSDRRGLQIFLYRQGTTLAESKTGGLNPSWILRDASGNPVRNRGGGNVILDVTSPEVRRWLTDGIAADVRASGYDGVYLDVLGAFFSESFYSGRPVIRGVPVSDGAWRDASVAVIREVKAATGKPVVANAFGLQSGKNYSEHPKDADQLIAAADGIQIEQFSRVGKSPVDRFRDSDAWQADVDLLRAVSAQKKIVLTNTRVDAEAVSEADSKQVSDFALASFLVGAEGDSAFFQFVAADEHNAGTELAPVVAALGAALGPPENVDGVRVRRFTGGEVAVNPTRDTKKVHLAGQTVTLAPHQGLTEVPARQGTPGSRPEQNTGPPGSPAPSGPGTPQGGGSALPIILVAVGGAIIAVSTGWWIRRQRRVSR